MRMATHCGAGRGCRGNASTDRASNRCPRDSPTLAAPHALASFWPGRSPFPVTMPMGSTFLGARAYGQPLGGNGSFPCESRSRMRPSRPCTKSSVPWLRAI